MRGEQDGARVNQRPGAQAEADTARRRAGRADDHLADAGDIDGIARGGRRAGIGDHDIGFGCHNRDLRAASGMRFKKHAGAVDSSAAARLFGGEGWAGRDLRLRDATGNKTDAGNTCEQERTKPHHRSARLYHEVHP